MRASFPFVVSHSRDARRGRGLRSFFEYRDFGIKAATGHLIGGLPGRMQSRAAVVAALMSLAAGCSKGAPPAEPKPGEPAGRSALGTLGTLGQSKGPESPKVPFGNQPCQSLSPADEGALGMTGTIVGKSDRAPATLPFDNVCTYLSGGNLHAQVGYQTQGDYDANSGGNRSKERQAPGDLPGAFYDRQGGLWFAKNGYYVVVSGKRDLREPVARVIAGKL